MTAAEFRALRQRLGLTREQMAERLDVSSSTISNYEGAGRPALPIPRVVAMACAGIEAQLQAALIAEWQNMCHGGQSSK